MNKKGQFVGFIITATIVVLLAANVFLPQVINLVRGQPFAETLDKSGVGANWSVATLTKASDGLGIESNSLAITGLTADTNYTIDYDTGVINFTNTTRGNYSSDYKYQAANYLTDNNDRSLAAVLIIAVLIGIIVFIFRGFGVA